MRKDLFSVARKGDIASAIALLESGTDINAPGGSYGETPLMVAAMMGHTKVVRLLIERGADVNARTSLGIQAQRGDNYSALMFAAEAGHVQIVELLLQAGANPQFTIRRGVNAADMAAKFGFLGCRCCTEGGWGKPSQTWELSFDSLYETNPTFMKRITAIDWFRNCGDPPQIAIDMRVHSATSWEQAERYYTAFKWGKTMLAAQNALSVYLARNPSSECNDRWNPTAIGANSFFQTEIYPKIRPVQEKNDLDDRFAVSVRRNITGAILEHSYQEFNPPVNFFRELLKVYEAGHFPCGWLDNDWPVRRLLVL